MLVKLYNRSPRWRLVGLNHGPVLGDDLFPGTSVQLVEFATQ